MLLGILRAACRGSAPGYTIEDFRREHPSDAASLVAGLQAVQRTAKSAPVAAIDAPCTRLGLYLGRNSNDRRDPPIAAVDGDTEILSEGPDWPAGPAVTWAREFETTHTMDCDVCKTSGPHDLERARHVKQLVVMRPGTGVSPTLDVLLVEFPSGKLVCSFQFAHPFAPYDLEAGLPHTVIDTGRIGAELRRRFGLIFEVPDASTAVTAARARYRQMLVALGRSDLPTCPAAAPAGAVRTTAKRLHVYAKTPALAFDDPNVTVEPDAEVDADFRKLVEDDTPLVERDAAAERLASAPATLVIDIQSETPAERSGAGFQPGSATGRQVQFSKAGEPVCQREATVTNSDSLRLPAVRGEPIVDNESVRRASREQLAYMLINAFK